MLQLENPVKTPVLGWIMAPKQANVLLPGTCEYVTFLGKKLFEQKITLRVLRQGDYLTLSRRVHHDHKVDD